jgi:hypothetical protein
VDLLKRAWPGSTVPSAASAYRLPDTCSEEELMRWRNKPARALTSLALAVAVLVPSAGAVLATAAPAAAVPVCGGLGPARVGPFGDQLYYTLYWDSCSDGTFLTNSMTIYNYGRSVWVKMVIVRYRYANWQGGTVVSWQSPATYWDRTSYIVPPLGPDGLLGYEIPQSLHPYVYLAYGPTSGGPWTASPITREG